MKTLYNRAFSSVSPLKEPVPLSGLGISIDFHDLFYNSDNGDLSNVFGIMTFKELHNQVLQLSISDRWRLVQSVLASIQQETLTPTSLNSSTATIADLDPWTQSLVGVIQLNSEDSKESYIDYLETKYK